MENSIGLNRVKKEISIYNLVCMTVQLFRVNKEAEKNYKSIKYMHLYFPLYSSCSIQNIHMSHQHIMYTQVLLCNSYLYSKYSFVIKLIHDSEPFHFNPYPAIIFCHKNVVCLLHPPAYVQMYSSNFKCRDKHYEL